MHKIYWKIYTLSKSVLIGLTIPILLAGCGTTKNGSQTDYVKCLDKPIKIYKTDNRAEIRAKIKKIELYKRSCLG